MAGRSRNAVLGVMRLPDAPDQAASEAAGGPGGREHAKSVSGTLFTGARRGPLRFSARSSIALAAAACLAHVRAATGVCSLLGLPANPTCCSGGGVRVAWRQDETSS